MKGNHSLQLFTDNGELTMLETGDVIFVEKFKGTKQSSSRILISIGRNSGRKIWPGRHGEHDDDDKIQLICSTGLATITGAVQMLCHSHRRGAGIELIRNRHDSARFIVI